MTRWHFAGGFFSAVCRPRLRKKMTALEGDETAEHSARIQTGDEK